MSIRYHSKSEGVQVYEHSVILQDGVHNEERFFFGLCPVSLRTSCLQDTSSTSFSELKVMVINRAAINIYFKGINLLSQQWWGHID